MWAWDIPSSGGSIQPLYCVGSWSRSECCFLCLVYWELGLVVWGVCVLRRGWAPGERCSAQPCTQLSTPDKVLIPERYIELEPDTPLSPEEMKEKQKKVERIKTLIAKSR